MTPIEALEQARARTDENLQNYVASTVSHAILTELRATQAVLATLVQQGVRSEHEPRREDEAPIRVVSSCGHNTSDDPKLVLFNSAREKGPMKVRCVKDEPLMHGFGRPLEAGDEVEITGTICNGGTFMVSVPSETAFYDYTHFEPLTAPASPPTVPPEFMRLLEVVEDWPLCLLPLNIREAAAACRKVVGQ